MRLGTLNAAVTLLGGQEWYFIGKSMGVSINHSRQHEYKGRFSCFITSYMIQ